MRFSNRCNSEIFTYSFVIVVYCNDFHQRCLLFDIQMPATSLSELYVFFKCEFLQYTTVSWQYTTIQFDKFPTKFLLQFVLFVLSHTILSHRLVVFVSTLNVGSSPFRLAFNSDHLHFCICYISLAYYKIQIYLQRQKPTESSDWDYVNNAVNTHFLEFPFSLGLWPLY